MLGEPVPPPRAGMGWEVPGAARTCERGETRQTRAEVQEKVYWRRTEASATCNPLPEWGGCPAPPRPGPAPHLLLSLLQPSGMGGLELAQARLDTPSPQKLLNSWGLAALRNGGTLLSFFSPFPEQRTGEREGGSLPKPPPLLVSRLGGAETSSPQTNQKKKKKQPKKEKKKYNRKKKTTRRCRRVWSRGRWGRSPARQGTFSSWALRQPRRRLHPHTQLSIA